MNSDIGFNQSKIYKVTQNRTDSWGLSSLYISKSILKNYQFYTYCRTISEVNQIKGSRVGYCAGKELFLYQKLFMSLFGLQYNLFLQ